MADIGRLLSNLIKSTAPERSGMGMLDDVLRTTTNRGIIDALPRPPSTHSERIAARTRNLSDADVLNSDELWAMTRDLMAHRADAGSAPAFSQVFSELASRRLGRPLTPEEISRAVVDGVQAGVITPRKLYGAAGGVAGTAAGGAALAPGEAQASFLPVEKKMPELPNQRLGDALATMAGPPAENQVEADAMGRAYPRGLPSAPPLPPPQNVPGSQIWPLPDNPSLPPWASQGMEKIVRGIAPHLSDPATLFGPRPAPSMVPNEVGKLYDPNAVDPRVQGAAADLAHIASHFVGPWWK